MRLGFVGLDTSHPESWIPIEREMGCDVVGFFDESEIHPPEYARSFAEKWGLRQFVSMENLADAVETVVIHSCNWDRHVEQARPFIEAGKAVFIDKPLAGRPRDIACLADWAKSGKRITGGSCFLGCREIREWQESSPGERVHTVFAGCAVDEFNYAIHAYAMASAVFGSGMQRTRWLGGSVQQQIQIEWTDGGCAYLSVGQQAKWLQAHLTIITDSTAVQLRPGTDRLYETYVRESLSYLFGQTEFPRVPFLQALECEQAALAAAHSLHNGGEWVKIDELMNIPCSFDGAQFAAEYRHLKYPTPPP